MGSSSMNSFVQLNRQRGRWRPNTPSTKAWKSSDFIYVKLQTRALLYGMLSLETEALTYPPIRAHTNRSFLLRTYPTMKKHNPHTPILIREASNTQPKVWARYGAFQLCRDLNDITTKCIQNLVRRRWDLWVVSYLSRWVGMFLRVGLGLDEKTIESQVTELVKTTWDFDTPLDRQRSSGDSMWISLLSMQYLLLSNYKIQLRIYWGYLVD
jgi:hypothetical protein